MKFPLYWARGTAQVRLRNGKTLEVGAFGWSSSSVDDARRMGEERARRSAARLESGQTRGKIARWYQLYPDVPPREEVLERIEFGGREIGVITRNTYGARILNTDCVLFVDVDLPENEIEDAGDGQQKKGVAGFLSFLTGKSKVPGSGGSGRGVGRFLDDAQSGAAPDAPSNSAEERILNWQKRNPDVGLRAYRTFAGYRVLFTDQLYEPGSARVAQIFSELGADPLYVKLTARQKCFRARLTPKPWRCGTGHPPGHWPRENARVQANFVRWLDAYAAHSVQYATCLPAKVMGRARGIPEIERIIEIHDAAACLASGTLA